MTAYFSKILNDGGFAAVEAEKEAVLPDYGAGMVLRKRYDYGNTSIWLYVKEEE